jgi:hypothetical protein
MNMSEFETLLARHGAEPRAWPAGQAAAARALLAASPAARQALDAARLLALALRETRPAADAETLARMQDRISRRVAMLPLPEARRDGWLQWLRPLLPAGTGALLTLAACGLWLNLATPEETGTGPSAPRLLLAMESD